MLLKRLVTFVTGSWPLQPTRRAASLKLFPQQLPAARPLVDGEYAFHLRLGSRVCNSCRSSAVTCLKSSDAERDMAWLLLGVFVQHRTFPPEMASDPLGYGMV